MSFQREKEKWEERTQPWRIPFIKIAKEWEEINKLNKETGGKIDKTKCQENLRRVECQEKGSSWQARGKKKRVTNNKN